MRVLMLGWEFPPHLSGGLGTACYGLCRGLASNRVQVTFVMPHASGDEDSRQVEIVGCDSVPMPGVAAGAPPLPASGTSNAPAAEPTPAAPGSTSSTSSTTVVESMLELLSVDSPLHAYATATSYRERLDTAKAIAIETAAAVRILRDTLLGHDGLGELRSGLERVLGETLRIGDAGHRYLAFSGTYGHDLVAEVARYALVVGELARSRQFDVVHAHDWLTVPAGIVAARVSGKPLVLHVHACEYDRSGENVNAQVRDIEQLGLDAADRVICVSHFTANVLRRRYRIDPAKLRVVHNAVMHHEQAAAWRAPKTIPEPIVLFLGRVTFQKGPDYFLEAAARVLQAVPHVKFVMSGSGDMLPAMVERTARLGIARHVHFTGFLRGRDVERMYAMASIYVMPSVSEPFGISPLEALALDVPVIVSRQSGVAEILTSALKVDFWDVEDLANKIIALLRHEALGRQLREGGKDEIRSFRWDQQGKLVAEVYEEVVQ